jgi:hypothetical protein
MMSIQHGKAVWLSPSLAVIKSFCLSRLQNSWATVRPSLQREPIQKWLHNGTSHHEVFDSKVCPVRTAYRSDFASARKL